MGVSYFLFFSRGRIKVRYHNKYGTIDPKCHQGDKLNLSTQHNLILLYIILPSCKMQWLTCCSQVKLSLTIFN